MFYPIADVIYEPYEEILNSSLTIPLVIIVLVLGLTGTTFFIIRKRTRKQ